MAQDDIFSGLSVDKILSDVKSLHGEDDLRLWSLDDVDKLLTGNAPTQSHTASEAPAEAETVQEKVPQTQPSGVSLKAAAKHIQKLSEEEIAAAEQEEIIPALLPSAMMPSESETAETESAEKAETEPAEAQPLPGQITIEKTRVFNEVESHAVYKADIDHKIGTKILRTTTGEFDPVPKRPVMETDAQRERFLNRPTQKLEKTQEHKELLSQLPPKTIEKPGVIVRKPQEEATGSDGLQAIPTLVLPEDELKEQLASETRVQAGTLKNHAADGLAEDAESPLADQMMLEGFDNAEETVERIDENEAELKLLARRREKAKKFRLFPGLQESDAPAEEDGDSEDAISMPQPETAEEKTKARIDLGDVLLAEEPDSPEEFTEDEMEEPVPRRQKRQNARRAAPPVTVLREFYGPKDGQAVYDIFLSEKRSCTLRLAIYVILMLASAASAFILRLTGGFALFNDSAAVYSAVHFAFLAIAAIVGFKEERTAVRNLLHGTVTAETGLLCALLFACIQAGISFAFPERLLSVPLYTAVAMLSYVLYFAGRKRKLKNDIANFQTVAQQYNRFYALGKIESPETAFEIGRGLLLGDPDVRYSKRIAFPAKFVETAKQNDSVSDVYAMTVPAVLIAAGIIGAITCFVAGEVFTGVSAMSAAVLAGLPLSAVSASAASLRSVNKPLLREGAMIVGYDAAFDATTANAVVLDAADLFDETQCRLRGMKIYHKMRVDEALLYTAAVTIQSGGTLAAVFDGVIQSKTEMLPEVESLSYEERLGCSGWIYNQRVLVGSRDLLIKHNVDAPSKEEEKHFRKDGCEVLYLAVEGKTAALFVVEYAANERLADYLQQLEKYGVGILVRTADPNVTEGLVEQYFDLPHSLVKIINPVAGEMFRELAEEPPTEAPCAILHSGRTHSFLRAFLSAFVLEEKYRLSQILLYIGVGLSVMLMAVLSFFTQLTQAGVPEILLFELIWAGIVIGVPRFKKI